MSDSNKKGDGSPNGNKRQNMINFLIIGVVITFIMNIIFSAIMSNSRVQLEYSQFINLVESGEVKQARFQDDTIVFMINSDIDVSGSALSKDKVYCTGAVNDPRLVDRLIENNVTFHKPIVNSNPIIDFFSSWIFPLVILYVIYYFLIKSMSKKFGGTGGFGGFMNVGKSSAKMYNLEKKTGITFADVAGQDEAKDSLKEMIDFLHNPEKYKKIGAKQPKGALLVGPPGTGKTLIAKAVAGEAGVPFFSLSGSEFVEMFVGVGASRVRDLFSQAAKNAPCIIFIDEIDAIGKKRDNQVGGNDEREQTLNQLLAEMDGFDSSKGIVILAATNRPEILDKALLRPGRFDRRVIVDKPDLPGREAILKVHADKVNLGTDVKLRDVALSTSGATGADLANMVNEAALRAVKMDREEVLQEDLMEAVELVIAGKEKIDRILNAKEKRMVAYHEVGHALTSALQKEKQPVAKITIVPRTMGALGYTMQMPEEERYLMTKGELLAEITALLSGRAAEELIFGESTTGASNDIERATKIARSMVTQYGMSDRFDMMGLESVQNQYLDGRMVPTCSEATGASIDEEVKKIIRECHENATELLTKNREHLVLISEHLIEKETITGEQFMDMLKG